MSSPQAETMAGPERGRDPARFASVIELYGPRLVRFLESRVGSRSDAQDLAQEAYFRLCRVNDPDLIREPENYLFRIASNLANEFMLRRRNQPPHLDIAAAEPELGEDGDTAYLAGLEDRSQVEMLEAILAELPPLYQAVLLMRKRDGFSHEEIAQRLSISPHTVHKYLSRALLKTRTLWVKRQHD